MDRILYFVNHLSIQDICSIAGIIISLITMIFQRKEVNKDFHIIFHHTPCQTYTYTVTQPPTQDTDTLDKGFVIRSFLIILAAICLMLLISSYMNASTAPSPIEQAKAVIQKFYESVNKKDYHAAYNLTSDGFSETYEQFVQGYSHTIHNVITFQNMKQLSNGNIQIFISIKATENTSTGTRSDYYEVLYTVGKRNNNYVILTGNFILGD